MKLGTARIIVRSVMAAVILFGIIAIATQSPIAYILMVLALAAELIVFLAYIKCPYCGRHLDRIGMNSDIECCPFCGKSLEEHKG